VHEAVEPLGGTNTLATRGFEVAVAA
jgi:hypothetical protein